MNANPHVPAIPIPALVVALSCAPHMSAGFAVREPAGEMVWSCGSRMRSYNQRTTRIVPPIDSVGLDVLLTWLTKPVDSQAVDLLIDRPQQPVDEYPCAVARPTSIRTPTSGRAGRSSGRSSRLLRSRRLAGRRFGRDVVTSPTAPTNGLPFKHRSRDSLSASTKRRIVDRDRRAGDAPAAAPARAASGQSELFGSGTDGSTSSSLSLLVRCQHRPSAIVTEPHGAAWQQFGEVAWLAAVAG